MQARPFKQQGTVTTLQSSSSLYLVDLAGSERIKKSKAVGLQLNEAVGINSSLLVLGKVISALVEGKSHIPYLESKLTTLLRNAFGGNCRTNVIVHCRPDDIHADETLQSLRFSERCSMILNETKTAAKSVEATLQAFDEVLQRMEKQLHTLKNGTSKSQMLAYKKVSESYHTLLQKRKDVECL